MKKLFTKGRIALLVIFSVLIIDQIIKIWIKTHMYWHESIRVTDWFYIYFTENNGMAFGMEIFGKLFLTTFRIVAVGLIGYYLYKIIKKGFKILEVSDDSQFAEGNIPLLVAPSDKYILRAYKTGKPSIENGKVEINSKFYAPDN